MAFSLILLLQNFSFTRLVEQGLMTTFVAQLEAMDLLRILLLVFQQYLEAQQPSLTLP